MVSELDIHTTPCIVTQRFNPRADLSPFGGCLTSMPASLSIQRYRHCFGYLKLIS